MTQVDKNFASNVKPLVEEVLLALREWETAFRDLDSDVPIVACAKRRTERNEGTLAQYRLEDSRKELVATIRDVRKLLARISTLLDPLYYYRVHRDLGWAEIIADPW